MAEIAAVTPVSALDLIERRSSTRKFADAPITDDQRAAVCCALQARPDGNDDVFDC